MTMAPAPVSPRESELLKSGASVGRNASARAGFMPLALEHVVLEGLASLPVYLRTLNKKSAEPEYQFTLYSTPAVRFTENHRMRLKEAGVKFIYITLQDQMQFRRQVEAHLEKIVADPALTLSTKSELVYETSVELVNELLTDQGLADKLPRLESISKAVATLVMNDASAFSQLFAASQHDFYTATHMVNVGTWMVPLAYSLGITNMDELNHVCVAGMLHDIGKIYVSEDILNKKGKLTDEDWQALKAHPTLGYNHLKKFDNMSELVLRVTAEHHERIDGSGYPSRLTGDKMLLASRICAVVDSFDAMTAFRPFKTKTESFGSALRILQNEAPTKYDKIVVDAWVKLMQRAEKDGALPQPLADAPSDKNRRAHERFNIQCPARLHRMEIAGNSWLERPAFPINAHSLSRSGLGFLSREAPKAAQYVRVYLMGAGTLADKVLDGQIVRCRDYSDGWHEVGMKFVSLAAERKSAESADTGSSPGA
jgi:HD-GYP domain-containing protein (c-di-GMP phosphodiesterase class II)